jgi:hypothetical protein
MASTTMTITTVTTKRTTDHEGNVINVEDITTEMNKMEDNNIKINTEIAHEVSLNTSLLCVQ